MRSRSSLPMMFVLAVAVVPAGCRKKTLSPEEKVRKAIAEAEKAVEDKDSSAVGDFVSAQYKEGDNDRRAVMGMLKLQFVRYPTISLFTRVGDLDFPAAGKARATVFAAMASLPIGGAADLARVSADLFRFELDLSEEDKGDWRVVRATWARAQPDDFL